MIVDNDKLPFKVTETHTVSRATGVKTPSTPEVYLQAVIFDKLCEISGKLTSSTNASMSATSPAKKIPP
jgi:hypothetical protein